MSYCTAFLPLAFPAILLCYSLVTSRGWRRAVRFSEVRKRADLKDLSPHSRRTSRIADTWPSYQSGWRKSERWWSFPAEELVPSSFRLLYSTSLFLPHFAHHVLVEKQWIDESRDGRELFRDELLTSAFRDRTVSRGEFCRSLIISRSPMMQSPSDALIRRLPRASFCNLPHVPRMKLRAHVRIVHDGREGGEGKGIIRTRVDFSVGCLWGLDQFSRTKLDSVYPMKLRVRDVEHMEYKSRIIDLSL